MAYKTTGATDFEFGPMEATAPTFTQASVSTDEAAEMPGGGSTDILGGILKVFGDAGKAVGTAVTSTTSGVDTWWDKLQVSLGIKRKAAVSSPVIPSQPAATPATPAVSAGFLDQKIGPVPMPLALLGVVGGIIYWKKRKKRR